MTRSPHDCYFGETWALCPGFSLSNENLMGHGVFAMVSAPSPSDSCDRVPRRVAASLGVGLFRTGLGVQEGRALRPAGITVAPEGFLGGLGGGVDMGRRADGETALRALRGVRIKGRLAGGPRAGDEVLTGQG